MSATANTNFDPRLGDPSTWSREKWVAVQEFKARFRRWPTHEIPICLGCGQPEPCKSDCPAGTGKALR